MTNNDILYGEVVWFDPKKGFGFIKRDDGQKDIFVHFSDVVVDGFKTLFGGQKVSFGIGKNKKGDPKAIFVTVLKN